MKYLKILTIAVLGLLLFAACKKDKQDHIIPADKRYLSSVTDETGKTVAKVTYYDDKKIKTFTFGDWEYRYVYDNNGKVSSVFSGNEECRYNYNSNGKIVNYSIKGQTYPVTYNSGENSYAFTSFVGPTKVFLDTKDNCTKVIYGANNPTTANFFYQNNRKGPLSNGGDMSLTNFISLVPVFLVGQVEGNLLAFPLEGFTGGNSESSTSASFANEYDSENSLLKSTITTTRKINNGNETNTIEYTYHYMEL